MNKLLMIGPFPDPVHGMSMANQMLLCGLEKKGYRVDHINTALLSKIESTKDQKKISFKKLFTAVGHISGELFKIFSNSYDVAYITPGHSFIGFMRYSPYMLACIIKRIPYFLHSHGGQLGNTYQEAGKLKKSTLKFLIKKSKGAIVLGDSLKWMFQDVLPPEKIFVCHNGVPEDIVSSKYDIENKLNKNPGILNLLYLSNLMEEKGILDLLNSLEYFIENHLNFKLNLAGNIEKNLEKDIYSLLEKNKDKVTYYGIIGGEKKRSLLLESDIFILPTYYPIEGQPISILEAMANGCAIVTTDQGGIGDIFQANVNGIECIKRNPHSIYDAVFKVSKELRRFQKQNYETALDNYTSNDFVKRVEKIINPSVK
ncbi:glycosyltransferase family 4 protein [Ilyobacter sp.]|uniref:glycosyltransferase family 4 protein n=1 Tax=Ilyobacter sp. TaxID=3100343 RepID=UPI003567CA7F